MPAISQAAILGAGPAGLQAALTLGRMHVETLIFDDASYRNSTSPHMQNVLGWDGATPAELWSAGRRELAAYAWVTVIDERVSAASSDAAGILLTTASAQWPVERLLLASGVEDTLLPIPGLRELWGDVVLPCPYCHGHEFSVGPIAIISSGGHADHIGALLRGLTESVPVLAPDEVAAVSRSDAGVTIALRNGGTVEAACVFIPPNPIPRSRVADDLGVASGPDGIDVDALGRTNLTNVWAAGDVAKRVDPRIPAAVVTAMASGLIAAADIAASVGAARDRQRT
jgi:thioredoxin reductase